MKTLNKIFFLINLKSGGRKAQSVFNKLNDYAACKQGLIAVEELKPSRLIEQLSRAQQCDILVIGGGDGTVSHIVNLLDKPTVKIGLMPIGTANDLARELNVTKIIDIKNIETTIANLQNATCRQVQIFELQWGSNYEHRRKFINYFAIGYNAKVIGTFAKLRQKKLWNFMRGVWSNRVAYAFSALISLFNPLLKNLQIRNLDSNAQVELKKSRSLIFANVTSCMGIGRSNKIGSAFDNKIECICTRSWLSYLAMIFPRGLSWFFPQELGSASGWELENHLNYISAQIDGESIDRLPIGKLKISTVDTINFLAEQ